MDLTSFTSAVTLVREVIQLLGQVKNLLPSDPKRQEAERRLEEAERSLRLAEAKVATELGYQLCKCTWPPQIMISKGFNEYDEIFECPKCPQRFPPPTPDLANGGNEAP